MGLSKINLQNDLYTAFDSMNSVYKNGEEYMATRCAEAIKNYLSEGVVNTVDGGKGTIGGVYTGKGKGTIQIDSNTLKNLFLTTLLTAKNNDDIALMMSNNVNAVCSMPNTINTKSVGTTTLPPSPPQADGGIGKGTFSGASTSMFLKLKMCFLTMGGMTKGGNMYFAQEFADAIHTYITSGTVNVTLQAPLIGSGTGNIS